MIELLHLFFHSTYVLTRKQSVFNGAILSDQSAIDLPCPFSESLFLVRQTLLSEVSRSCCSASTSMRNDVFPCTLLNPLWAWTVTRHTSLSDLGQIFTMLIFIDHHWLTSCNPIWIPLVSIWLSKICIQSFSKWHSSHKVNHILQLYILLLCYCTIGIWVNMLYLTDHLMNLSITINNC